MNKKIKNLAPLFLVIFFIILFSCRSIEKDDSIMTTDSVPLKISFSGTDYEKEPVLATASTSTFSGAGYKVPLTNSHAVMLSPSRMAVIESLPDVGVTDDIQSKSKKNIQIAAVNGSHLDSGMMFRVIAYGASDGMYKTHQDYTVNDTSTPLILTKGESYDIVAYSYGASVLPKISQSEIGKINNALIRYDDSNSDFMYQKLKITPTGYTPLNLKLRHKFSMVTITLDVTKLGMGEIENIDDAYIEPHYKTGSIYLSSGRLTRNTRGNVAVDFSGIFPTDVITSSPVMVNANVGSTDPNGDLNNVGRLLAKIDVGGRERKLEIPPFPIKPEHKQNIKINFTTCGAYLGPNKTNFKAFMCHNLGADTTVNGLTPSSNISGAIYQWGAKTNEEGRYVDQQTNQNSSGATIGWRNDFKPADSWLEDRKGVDDPCPSGYKVPSRSQWKALIENNTLERIGVWNDDDTNYSSGLKIGDRLFLPAAGGISGYTSVFSLRGYRGLYWSSIFSTNNKGATSSLIFDKDSIRIADGLIPINGQSVRCVSE